MDICPEDLYTDSPTETSLNLHSPFFGEMTQNLDDRPCYTHPLSILPLHSPQRSDLTGTNSLQLSYLHCCCRLWLYKELCEEEIQQEQTFFH